MSPDLLRAQASLDETVSAIQSLDQDVLKRLADLIASLGESQGILWTMGNGGSSSTGSHMACDVGKGIGASLDAAPADTPAHAFWFGEDQGRYIITVPDVEAFQAQIAKGTRNEDTASSGLRRLGTVGGDSLFGVKVAALKEANLGFFREWMEG